MNKLCRKLDKLNQTIFFYGKNVFLEKKAFFGLSQEKEQLLHIFNTFDEIKRENILKRVAYYNKLNTHFQKDEKFMQIKDFSLKGNGSRYYYDLAPLLFLFNKNNYFAYKFGDVTETFKKPIFVKSRPINTKNDNSILLKLDSLRHFYIPQDNLPFKKKKPKLVWRGAAHQPHRITFLEKFYTSKLLDVGCTAKRSTMKPYHVKELTIDEQREYKFLLSIEGNDVASSLKWNLASNSLVFMTRPKYETWFMEGTLKPNFHYVLLKDNYEDLEEKIDYYRNNDDKAQEIIENAHRYIEPFLDKNQEKLIQLLVIKKYFDFFITDE